MTEDTPRPTLLTTLSYSGGRQSSWILWELILGLRPVPENFVVLAADPGMEKRKTYRYRDMMFNLCRENGIKAIVCPGPNLYKDIVNLRYTDRTRLDSPAYFVAKPGGKRGKLPQKCTRHYKIAPMAKQIRAILQERYGIHPRSGRIPGKVETWIGFATDEAHRIKPSRVAYAVNRYPLIESGVSRTDINIFYQKYGIPAPPPSVCNGCFSHGLASFAQMKKDDVRDFLQAVEVDEAIRDWRRIGVDHPAYVSDTLIPLQELAERDFDLGDPWENDKHSCNHGVCFI